MLHKESPVSKKISALSTQGAVQVIVGIILGVGLLGGIAYWGYATWQEKSALDFGDAPDGSAAYAFGEIEILGKFASRRASNGARTKDVTEVWLGEKADKELESRQVNTDQFDDGVALRMESGKASQAYFAVHVKEPGKTVGTAYLNLWVDWNKDGQWSGQDGSATEWTVKNLAIDLGKQSQELEAYTAEFTAGQEAKDVWYRAAVSVDQQFVNEDATGEFSRGEVEDYGPPLSGKEKNFWGNCDPEPLMLAHGQGGFIEIVAGKDSEPVTFYGVKKGTKLKDDAREIKDSGVRSLYYKSTQVDGPKRLVMDQVDIQYQFQGWSKKFTNSCDVWVQHDENGGGGPPPGGDDDQDQDKDKDKDQGKEKVTYSREGLHPPETPAFKGGYETGSKDGVFYMNLMVTPTTLAGGTFTGMEIDLNSQRPPLPAVDNCSANANLDGWGASNWRSNISGSVHRWFGSTPMRQNKKSIMTLYFSKPFTPPATMHMNVLDKDGKTYSVNLTK